MSTWRVTLHEGRRGSRMPYTVEIDAPDGRTAADRAKVRCRDCGVPGYLRILRITEVSGGEGCACA